jgi:ataxin-7
MQTHALSLRRAVPGRRKKFDELLAEHKARVNCEKEQQQQNLAALKLLESKNADKNNVIKGNGLIMESTTRSSNDKYVDSKL